MEKHCEHKRHSGSFWAYVIIVIGLLWMLKRSGWDINLPGIGDFFSGLGHFFGSFAGWASSAVLFPVLIIFIGILLLVGRRFFGALFLVLLVMMLLPHLLIIPGILMIVFFPFILIGIGIVILTKLF